MTHKSPFLLIAATLLCGLSARADVSWQHTGRVTATTPGGNETLLTFNFDNSWSGANHRAHFKYDASALADDGMIDSTMTLGDATQASMARGELNVIERLDDDSLVVSVPTANTYVEEPYSMLKERLRLNIWQGLDSSLDKGDIPELTQEQRARLGHELRALYSPFTRRLTRTFFRQLPNRRVIKGLNCRGYRYTTLVNVSGKPGGNGWTKLAAEWWLADVMPGDQEIGDFTQRANKLKTDGGPPTNSMWLNEYAPVLWQVAPPELHRALQSLVGYEESATYGFAGTPAQFFVTFTLPKTAYTSDGQAVRVVLELQSRTQTSVAPAIFQTPTTLKRQPIEPLLKLAQNGIKQMNQEINKALDKELGPMQKPM